MSETKAGLLIVEDELPTRILLSQILTRIGYRVRSATDGFTALREIRQECPQILLSDLNMSGMSGFELLSVVRRRFPQIHVIAMSGAFSGLEVPSGVAADAFFQKSSSIPCLLRMMESVPNPQRKAAESSASLTQVWISKYGYNESGQVCGAIECPECLRSFSHVLNATAGQIGEADCVSCGSLVHYAIMHPAQQPPSLSFQRKHGVDTPSLSFRPNVRF